MQSLLVIIYYFNSRTHKGCDVSYFSQDVFSCISIHAPIKDATISKTYDYFHPTISIHAPIKDATMTV